MMSSQKQIIVIGKLHHKNWFLILGPLIIEKNHSC